MQEEVGFCKISWIIWMEIGKLFQMGRQENKSEALNSSQVWSKSGK